jgi:ribosomal protein L40E
MNERGAKGMSMGKRNVVIRPNTGGHKELRGANQSVAARGVSRRCAKCGQRSPVGATRCANPKCMESFAA